MNEQQKVIDHVNLDSLEGCTRPYKIHLVHADPVNGTAYAVIEYLDCYEYDSEHLWKINSRIEQGWGVYEYYTNSDNDPCVILRRIRQPNQVIVEAAQS